jgi:hypothetical protein
MIYLQAGFYRRQDCTHGLVMRYLTAEVGCHYLKMSVGH